MTPLNSSDSDSISDDLENIVGRKKTDERGSDSLYGRNFYLAATDKMPEYFSTAVDRQSYRSGYLWYSVKTFSVIYRSLPP